MLRRPPSAIRERAVTVTMLDDLLVGSPLARDELIAAVEGRGEEIEKGAQREGFDLRNLLRGVERAIASAFRQQIQRYRYVLPRPETV